jgi:hypothetical protein
MQTRHQLILCGLEARPLPGQREIFITSASTGHQQRDGSLPAVSRSCGREVQP